MLLIAFLILKTVDAENPGNCCKQQSLPTMASKVIEHPQKIVIINNFWLTDAL